MRTALSLKCPLGFLALATDVGVLLVARRNAQAAANCAAVAAVKELNWALYDDTTVTATARAAAAQNGFTNGSDGTVTTCARAAATCVSPTPELQYVQVSTQSSVDPLFHLPALPKRYTVNGYAIMRVG